VLAFVDGEGHAVDDGAIALDDRGVVELEDGRAGHLWILPLVTEAAEGTERQRTNRRSEVQEIGAVLRKGLLIFRARGLLFGR
jgi:hypothetical protein